MTDRRWLRLLLTLYPPSFRRRYAAELEALVEDAALGARDALDLAAGAGLAWLRHLLRRKEIPMLIPFAWRHPRPLAVLAAVLLVPTATVVVGSLLAYELAVPGVERGLAPLLAAVNAVRVIDLAIVVAPAVALLVAMLPLVRIGVERGGELDGQPGFAAAPSLVVGVRLVWANVAVALLALVIGGLLAGHIVTEAVLEAGP